MMKQISKEDLERRLDEIEKRLGSRVRQLEADVQERDAEIARLKDTKSLDVPNALLGALADLVDERLTYWKQTLSNGTSNTTIDQTQPLEHIKSKLEVQEIKRTLPKEDSTTPRGKILLLIAQGKLDTPQIITKIQEMSYLSRIEVAKLTGDLAKEHILLAGKTSDNRIAYQKHPDLEVKQV